MKTRSDEVSGLFERKKMILIASLPANDAALAKAAASGGADLIKIHLNVTHAASGTHFGAFAEERAKIEEILATATVPVGIMPGADNPAPIEDMLELERMGVAFYDIYAHDMPAEYLTLEKMEPMAALGPGWKKWQAREIGALGVKLLEASIVSHESYGKRLTLSDLASYTKISSNFSGAVIVPTQKAIRPSELPILRESGVRGIMIGKIVAGDDPARFEDAAASFSAAIENL